MQDWSIISSAAGTIPAAIIADTASPAVLILLKSASSVLIARGNGDRKSTRLNSSHSQISYAVFCLKKKKKKIHNCAMIKRYRGHAYSSPHDQPRIMSHAPVRNIPTRMLDMHTPDRLHSYSSV